jgi:N-acetylglucosamine-6-sulfatase
MSRHLVAVVAVVLVLISAGQTRADTVRVPDPVDRIGLHDIATLVVDNTGPTVGVTVVHRGSAWTGRVRLEIDVSGSVAPEFVAVIRHTAPLSATFTRADGSPWPCATRKASSPPASTRTTVSAARRCFAMAPRMAVRALSISAGHSTDVATSEVVLQQTRPNVVMIMVDDMRDDDLRFMPWTRQLIGDQGVRFRNAFAPYPLCCPARASVLTGRYTHNHRVFDVVRPWGFTSFDDRSTLATWLHQSGYATVYLGKYLNGYGPMPRPGATTGNSLHYVPPGWDGWRASLDGGFPAGDPNDGGTYRYFDTTLSSNGTGFSPYQGRYQSRVYGEVSESIVTARAASDKPFFFYASYSAPHHGLPVESDDPGRVLRSDGLPVDFVSPARPDDVKGMFDSAVTAAPGASWIDPDFSDKPGYLRRLPLINAAEKRAMLEVTRQRAEALAVVDRQVHRTITALAATGELEETLVIFTSDNGYFLGEQRMRQGKIWPHEPSLRVPLLMRGPGIPAGQTRSDPFTSIDFAPTIADFAGVTPGHVVDGMSLLDVARQGDKGWLRPILTETGNQGNATRNTDEAGQPLKPGGTRDVRFALGIRTSRYLYVDLASGEHELYDLVNDPSQYTNLANDPAYVSTMALFQEELMRIRACHGEECRAPMAPALSAAPTARTQR